MKKKYLLAFFLLFHSQIFSESNDIKTIINEIISINRITSKNIGESGSESQQYKNFSKFKTIAKDSELIKLTDNKNAVLRCYSFKALVERRHKNVFSILVKHLNDKSQVETQYGCIISQIEVGQYFIEESENILTYKEIKELNHLLLIGKDIDLYAKNDLLRFLKPDEENYNRIKEIVESEKNDFAVIALAKFRKETDIKYILSLLNRNKYLALTAIREYPHLNFFPYIKEIHNQEIKRSNNFEYSMIRMLYKAIVQYKNKESLKLLEKTLSSANKSAREYHIPFIFLALELYPNSIYLKFKKKIELDDFDKIQMPSLLKIRE